MSYDSTADTIDHIGKVADWLYLVGEKIARRARDHDASKLESPEKEAFDVATPKLANLEYGTDEYRAALREIKPALQHHYAHNSHHPEHYENGIAGMSLLDLIEMLCDWQAASERHTKGKPISESIAYNQQRFGYTDEVRQILENTAKELGL